MPFSARLFRLLESELNRHLSFSLSIVTNLSDPGSRRIRVLDRFRIRVTMRNDSALAVKQIRGTIGPTPLAEFTPTSFRLDRLGSGEQAEIAQIDLAILDAPSGGRIFDLLATVNVSAEADLSTFRFKDLGRPVGFAQPASETRDAEIAAVPRNGRPAQAPERRRDPWGQGAGLERVRPVAQEG